METILWMSFFFIGIVHIINMSVIRKHESEKVERIHSYIYFACIISWIIIIILGNLLGYIPKYEGNETAP